MGSVIIVECNRCHRPVARVGWSGAEATILGTVQAENGDPGGVVNTWAPRLYQIC
jgi:hypothetical protein